MKLLYLLILLNISFALSSKEKEITGFYGFKFGDQYISEASSIKSKPLNETHTIDIKGKFRSFDKCEVLVSVTSKKIYGFKFTATFNTAEDQAKEAENLIKFLKNQYQFKKIDKFEHVFELENCIVSTGMGLNTKSDKIDLYLRIYHKKLSDIASKESYKLLETIKKAD
ncbi:MAG: hypothetical protein NE328_18350 [Lentisphaeraceae bacterium]|nr:hypothetical protein [Lentisphaeraceae bacterium]